MSLSNKDYYRIVMEQYKKNINRLTRTNQNAILEMEKLEKLELKIIENSNEFADVISLLQNRPKFGEIIIEQVKIPELDTKEIMIQSNDASKKLSKYATPQIGISGLLVTPDIETKGVFNHDIPLLEGSILGVEVAQGLDKIAGLPLFQALGSKESDKIYKISKEVNKIEEKINSTIPILERIKNSANKYHNSIQRVYEIYLREFEIVKKAVEKTKNYIEFLDYEKIAIKNSIMLIGILYQMCKVKLLKTSDMEVENIEINSEVDKKIDDSEKVLVEVDINYKSFNQNFDINKNELDGLDKSENINDEAISMECADAVNIHKKCTNQYGYVVYIDENNKLFKVNKRTGEKLELDIGIDLSKASSVDICGYGDILFLVLAEEKFDLLYQYTISEKISKCICKLDKMIDNENFYIQCNEQYVTFLHKCIDEDNSSSFFASTSEVIIYDYIESKQINTSKGKIGGYLLYNKNIYYNIDDVLFGFSILDQKKEKICSLDYEFMNYNGYNREKNAIAEDNKIISWSMEENVGWPSDKKDSLREGIKIVSIDLDTHKKKKWSIKDYCNIMGTYSNGYIYYIRCDAEDSLYRYCLETKKKEEIVKQTDCSWSAVSGFIKKSTTYYINREEVNLHILGDYLYYFVKGESFRDGSVMRVELNNDFLLSEIYHYSNPYLSN